VRLDAAAALIGVTFDGGASFFFTFKRPLLTPTYRITRTAAKGLVFSPPHLGIGLNSLL